MNAVATVLAKRQPLSEEDRQVIRENPNDIRDLTGRQGAEIDIRMQIELITAISSLDRTSTLLINTTNLLTQRILWLTVVGVILTFVGVAAALIPLFK